MDLHYTIVPREIPPQTTLARELRGILRSTGPTGAHYSRLDQILVNVQRRDYPRLISVYRYYPGGGQAFLNDLEHFVARIPGHEGEDPNAARLGYFERWTARLYDAGIRDIQLRFRSTRPVPAIPENFVPWRSFWRQYFRSEEGRVHASAPVALWILEHWNRITNGGDQFTRMERVGWLVRTSGNQDYEGSYSVLSAQPTVHAEGMRAGLSYFAALAGRHDEMVRDLVQRAQAYHEAYVALNFPVWRGVPKTFEGASEGLDQGISDMYHLDQQMRLPNAEAHTRISALYQLLTDYWRRGNNPPSALVRQAGINMPSGVL